jgi:multidrug efflux pump subunit AcrB
MIFTAALILGSVRRTVILGVVVVCSLQAVFVVMMLFDLAFDAVTLGGLTLGSGLFATATMMMLQGRPPRADDAPSLVMLAAAVAMAVPAALVSMLFTNIGAAASFWDVISVFCTGWVVSSLLALLLVSTFDRRQQRKDRAGDTAVSNVIARWRQSHNRLLRRLLRFPVATLLFLVLFFVTVTTVVFLDKQEMVFVQNQTEKIVLRIQGPEFALLSELGDRIQNRLRQLPTTREVSHSATSLIEMPVLRMNEDRARDLDINIIEAGRALAIGVSGINVGSFRDAEHRYDIRLSLQTGNAKRAPEWRRVLLRGELDDRSAVYLQDVATLEHAVVPARLLRYKGSPAVELAVVPENAAAVDQLLGQVRAALKNIQLPTGYHLSYAVPEEIPVHYGAGLQGLGWALLGVYILMALICRSLYFAALVTLSACFALSGVSAALLLFGLPASPEAWLGAQILIGIAASYAAVPALYLQALSRRGVPLRTMVTRSARQLSRPLLAVTLLGILGMLPLMWTKTEAVNFQPFVIIIATGLVFSFIAASLVMFLLYFAIPGQKHQPSGH